MPHFRKIQLPATAVNMVLFLVVLVWTLWMTIIGPSTAFSIVEEHWPITLTMIFGSLVAGATSEGGGAIAFPVFTKILHISPIDAKVFSLAIQSVGMTAASLVILALRIPVEWRVIIWVSWGGVIGIILGSLVAPLLPPSVVKMSFTVLVTSFAVTLFILNRGIRLFHMRLPRFQWVERRWLIAAGIIGGVMSGLVGNGIDIITFSVMVLYFRISEKIATPTSVILMAINALVGFSLHYFVLGGFNETVQSYWLSAVPVVVVGAPLGAIICSMMSREWIVRALLMLIAIEFISSILLIPFTPAALLASAIVAVVFSTAYYLMYRSQIYKPIDT